MTTNVAVAQQVSVTCPRCHPGQQVPGTATRDHLRGPRQADRPPEVRHLALTPQVVPCLATDQQAPHRSVVGEPSVPCHCEALWECLTYVAFRQRLSEGNRPATSLTRPSDAPCAVLGASPAGIAVRAGSAVDCVSNGKCVDDL